MVTTVCTHCGESLRHSDAEVPATGTIVKCPNCKGSISILPAIAVSSTSDFELDDFEMVEMELAPAGPTGLPRPVAPKVDSIDLLAPLSPKLGAQLPRPIARKEDSVDLPAPVSRGATGLPRPVARKGDSVDLPAPVSRGAAGLPRPVARKEDSVDLPAPVRPKESSVDLPMPVSRGATGLPRPVVQKGDSVDLPAPVRPKESSVDLPMPVSRGATGLPRPVVQKGDSVDLPMPVSRGATGLPRPVVQKGDSVDLPAPVSRGATGLPRPVVQKGDSSGLPTPIHPRGISDVPAPLGQPQMIDLPAPIDDLASPAIAMGLPVPSNREKIADLPGPVQTLDLVDRNLPAPISGSGQSGLLKPVSLGNPLDDDPLGGVALGDPLGSGLDLGDPLGGGLDLGDPLGGGLDLGDPLGGGLDLGDPLGSGLDIGDPLGGGLDLGDGGLDLGDPLGSGLDIGDPLGGGLDIGDPGDPLGGLDLGDPGDPLGGALDLGSPEDPLGGLALEGPSNFDGLDLEAPSVGPSMGIGLDTPKPTPSNQESDGVVTFGSTKKSSKSVSSRFTRHKKSNDDDAILDLEDTPLPGTPLPKAKQKKARAKPAPNPNKEKPVSGTRKKIGVAALGITLLGAGGFFGYSYLQDKEKQTIASQKESGNAQQYLLSDVPGHWQKAATNASTILKKDKTNAEAYAIIAQAHFASIVDIGKSPDEHRKRGTEAINKMRKLGGASSQIPLAEGLSALIIRRYDVALKQFLIGVQKNPESALAQIYLGWAYATTRQYEKAITAYDAALKLSEDSIIAHYGKANALLKSEKKTEANEEYLAVIALSQKKLKKDHLGAIVGIAQLVRVKNFIDRENRYLEIIAREDLAKQNARAVSQVWTLAGDEARLANRLAVATERYEAAVKANPENLNPVIGLAAISHFKKNDEDARAKLDRVLALEPQDIQARLLSTEVYIATGALDRAADHLASLFESTPKITHKPTLAKMELLRGHLLAVDLANADDAEKAYNASLSLSTDGGIKASLALAQLYDRLDRTEDSLATLLPLLKESSKNASLAVSLGLAYLRVDNKTEAITSFRTALKQRPNDAEARFQLGRTLALNGQKEEAIKELKTAYEKYGEREDIGLELADMYRQLEMQKEAISLYETILNAAAPTRNARAKVGAYFARIGEIEKAGTIGDKLLAENPKDSAGHFLKGESAYSRQDFITSRNEYLKATKVDGPPQYYNALGQAHVKLEEFTEAIAAFTKAISKDANYIEPRLGMAELRLARKEYGEVLAELEVPIKLDPNRERIHFLTGLSYLYTRQYKEALAALQRAIGLDGTHAEAYYYFGKTHDALGKAKAAAKAYHQAIVVAERENSLDEVWVTECYRLLGYALRESGGSRSGQLAAFESYISRKKIDDPLTREVKEFLISLRSGR